MTHTAFCETPTPPTLVKRRKLLGAVCAGFAAFLLPSHGAAQVWRQTALIRDTVGNATVLEQGLQLTLPLVAEDGSSVPLSVTATDLDGQRIVQLKLFATGNPTPEVAVFEFADEIDTLNLATRIRLSESQTVVAVARLEDGRFIIAERPVRVTTSGCIAPARSDSATEMNARVRVPKELQTGTSAEIITMISHPMVTGLATNSASAGSEQRIIRSFQATIAGRPVVKAEFFRSLAANPYVKFDLVPKTAGDMQFVWVEDTGRRMEHTEKLRFI